MTAVCGGASGKASFWKLDMRASVEGLLLVGRGQCSAFARYAIQLQAFNITIELA